jgi:hypothetical protein
MEVFKMKAKGIVYDAKTGELKEVETEYTPPPEPTLPNPIDLANLTEELKKIKEALVKANLLTE